MQYTIEFKPAAVRDLRRLSPPVAKRVLNKLEGMRDNSRVT